MRRRGRAAELENRLVWQAASLLLDYPDDVFAGRLDTVDRISENLPSGPASQLGGVARELRSLDPFVAQAQYVETFDLKRRATLYLTYWTSGDTRNRGTDMLRFIRAYRESGTEPPQSESPDHLTVVLEFAATVGPRAGGELLLEHAVAIRLIHTALDEQSSPYARVLAAVSATLPAATGLDVQQAHRLATQGPPVESVGLAPFDLTVMSRGDPKAVRPEGVR